MTVFTGAERRRRWSHEDKLRIVAEAFSQGACVREVARRNDLSTGLIYTWRRNFRRELPSPLFAQAVMAEEPETEPRGAAAAIVIDLHRVGRVSICPSASPALVSAALKALK